TEMSGNLCRCTGYVGIVNAIEQVMHETAQDARAPSGRTWLGPAPGPGRSEARTATATPAPARQAIPARPVQARGPSRPAIKVTVGAIEDVDGTTR
ncbi:hypothetical protein ACO1KX_13785, partial [Staphylococcus aureus]